MTEREMERRVSQEWMQAAVKSLIEPEEANRPDQDWIAAEPKGGNT
jgi:hypothetical protein